ncbi:MAG: single-stranded DNA-binding protein, partial [Bacteroidota bacterium]
KTQSNVMNRVMLIGNLGKDPEQRQFDNGTNRVSFSIATSERYQDKDGNWQESTEWHEIVMWRNQAENAMKLLKKGTTIFLEGKLTHRSWTDTEGKNRKTTEVVGSMFRVLEKRNTGSDYQTPAFPGGESQQKSTGDAIKEGEDLPF